MQSKNMNMKQKTRMGRITLLVVLLLVATVFLASCGGKTEKVSLSMPQSIAPADGGNLTANNLLAVGNMLSSVYDDASFDVRDWLIAASRGYNMIPEEGTFEDKPEYAAQNGTEDPVTVALAVLRKANAQAADSAKISEENFASMNEADLNQLIGLFKTTVVTAQNTGVWDGILRGIGSCLKWITTYLGFGSYIVGICIFAIAVEILMIPFAIKQQKNSIRQAQLRPKEMAIRNKYKGRNDQVTQQKIQKEIQELYQRENYSPMGGCFQLLLQFPILIALYNIVIDPLHYVLGQGTGITAALNSYYTAACAAGGMGNVLSASSRSTISLLSNNGINAFEGIKNFAYFNNGGEVWSSLQAISDVPNFNIFGINFGVNPSLASVDILLLVPIVTFVVYFFSMRLTRKFTYQPTQSGMDDRQAACSNTMMDVTMPMMSTFFAFMVPGIIGVYWIFRSLLTTVKQFIMSRVMPLPQFGEEDYKAAAKEMAGKAPKVAKSENAGRVRSLHHIDDEDYDDTREKALLRKSLMEEKEREEQEKQAKHSPFGAAELKSDKRDDASEE